MANSVVYSSIFGAVMASLPAVSTRLVVFDTEVVDLTDDMDDPVEVLFSVQLGGGTDIAKAVAYAQSRISNPGRSIVVLVSDFYEGGSEYELVRRVKALVESGVKVLGLAALDPQARPAFDRDMAARLVAAGAQVGAMTPGELAAWLAEKVRA